MVDSHVHFWKYEPVKDAWITAEMAVLQQDFLPPDFQALAGTSCVAVQAEQADRETHFLTELAQEHPAILGVVGWTNLCDPGVAEKLMAYRDKPIIKGFRHIVQAEKQGFLLQPDFVRGIHELGRQGYTYDILVKHEQLPEVIRFLDQCPAQPFVLDHCGKPGIAARELDSWRANLKAVAGHSHVYCKVSGLLTEADWLDWQPDHIFRYLDVVFDLFGDERLLFGSDWPVVQLAGGYRAWLDVLERYLLHAPATAKTAFFGGNAKKFYNLT